MVGAPPVAAYFLSLPKVTDSMGWGHFRDLPEVSWFHFKKIDVVVQFQDLPKAMAAWTTVISRLFPSYLGSMIVISLWWFICGAFFKATAAWAVVIPGSFPL